MLIKKMTKAAAPIVAGAALFVLINGTLDTNSSKFLNKSIYHRNLAKMHFYTAKKQLDSSKLLQARDNLIQVKDNLDSAHVYFDSYRISCSDKSFKPIFEILKEKNEVILIINKIDSQTNKLNL
jgi:hypothetical protein